MSEVSVIGLGNMGSALARVLQENRRTVTVWNRSPEKAAPLVEKGAVLAPSTAAAITASPLIIVCVTNYAASNRILGEVATNLPDKLLVQFTTGTPEDARTSEALFQKLLPVKSLPQALLAGMAWGWLPCGLVYSVLVSALAAGTPPRVRR